MVVTSVIAVEGIWRGALYMHVKMAIEAEGHGVNVGAEREPNVGSNRKAVQINRRCKIHGRCCAAVDCGDVKIGVGIDQRKDNVVRFWRGGRS